MAIAPITGVSSIPCILDLPDSCVTISGAVELWADFYHRCSEEVSSLTWAWLSVSDTWLLRGGIQQLEDTKEMDTGLLGVGMKGYD